MKHSLNHPLDSQTDFIDNATIGCGTLGYSNVNSAPTILPTHQGSADYMKASQGFNPWGIAAYGLCNFGPVGFQSPSPSQLVSEHSSHVHIPNPIEPHQVIQPATSLPWVRAVLSNPDSFGFIPSAMEEVSITSARKDIKKVVERSQRNPVVIKNKKTGRKSVVISYDQMEEFLMLKSSREQSESEQRTTNRTKNKFRRLFSEIADREHSGIPVSLTDVSDNPENFEVA